MTHVVCVQWIMVAEVEVEAPTLDAAMQKTRDNFAAREQRLGATRALPVRGASYLDDSFEVNEDVTRENAEKSA